MTTIRKIAVVILAVFGIAGVAMADENSEHLEHLRAMLHEMANHGPAIPQPAQFNPNPLAAKSISITARSFSFSPSSFTVNQGDVVTLTVSVPGNDPSTVGHGLLMDTYVEGGIDVPTGRSETVTFTATTAGTFPWVCTQPSCGTGHSSMFGQMIVTAVTNPGPSVTSVFPTSGPIGGGTTVIVSGSNFQTSGTTQVRFDTTPATSVHVTSSSSLSVVSPAHDPGTVAVTVINPDGSSGTLPNAFTYSGPSITSITPSTGSTAGGTSITISGSGFQSGATVKIGGIAASNVNVVNSTTITATTPLGPANEQVALPKDVVVTNPDGTTITKPGAFTYFVPPLSILTVSPSVGVPSGGTVVTITGTGFTTALNAQVFFGGTAATNVRVLDAVTLQATSPAHGTGSVDIAVSIGNTSVSKAGAFAYENAPPRKRVAHH